MTNNYLNTLKRMNGLIRRQATGSPKEFARKLDISESSLYNYIKKLREDFNAPVIFDFHRETYRYEEHGSLVIGFRKLTTEEVMTSSGGYYSGGYNFFENISTLQII